MSAVSVCPCGRAIPSDVLRRVIAAGAVLRCSACGYIIKSKEAAARLKKIVGGADSATDPIQATFDKFHADHPDIYEMFKRFARQLRGAGRERYGAKSIMERIRWELATSSSGVDDGFKINNNFTSRYARKLIVDDPTFESFFETRKLAVNRGA